MARRKVRVTGKSYFLADRRFMIHLKNSHLALDGMSAELKRRLYQLCANGEITQRAYKLLVTAPRPYLRKAWTEVAKAQNHIITIGAPSGFGS